MANGKPRDIARYIAGKMMDHSAWTSVLPRRCSPSDIDAVFDDMRSGRTVLVEFKESLPGSPCAWSDVAWAQRVTYSRQVSMGTGKTFAVLACWSGKSGSANDGTPCVDTVRDIQSFDVMYFAAFDGTATTGTCDAGQWVPFMQAIYSDATATQCLDVAKGMVG